MSKIFISYRRADSEDLAGRIAERMRREFADKNVFFDVNSILSGERFAEVIEANVNNADIVLILIGSLWVTAAETDGTKRLDNPEDFVRREVELALRRGKTVTVVPVLLKNAPMPRTTELPPSLHDLTKLNVAPVRTGRDFDRDIEDLIATIRSSHKRRSRVPRIAAVLLITLLVIATGILALVQLNNAVESRDRPSATVESTSEAVIVAKVTTPAPTNTHTPEPTSTPSATFTLTLHHTDTFTAFATEPQTAATATRTVETMLPTSTRIPTLTPTTTNTAAPADITPSGAIEASFPCDANIISSESQILRVVRSYPSDSSPAVTTVVPNEPVIVLDISRQNTRTFWYQIARNENEALGWIAPRYVVLSRSCPSP